MKLERLRSSFPKLMETNQFYVLGLIEGLKYVQEKRKEEVKAIKPIYTKKGMSDKFPYGNI